MPLNGGTARAQEESGEEHRYEKPEDCLHATRIGGRRRTLESGALRRTM
jgi:hypothetical protein